VVFSIVSGYSRLGFVKSWEHEMKKQHNNVWKKLVQSKMSRRGFLRGIGVGAATMTTTAAAPVGIARAAEAVANTKVATSASTSTAIRFTPIDTDATDDITLPEGFSYQVLISQGDTFTPDGRIFGDNNDWQGWFPIDALEGGNSQTEGILAINNEYFNPLFIGNYVSGAKTPEQVAAEKAAVGVSHVHVRREGDRWVVVTESEYARRYDATDPIEFSGPVAEEIGLTEVIGTLANCSGGITPWNTNLSCEENFQNYYGEDSTATGSRYQWREVDMNDGQAPEHYGWVVETDPYSGRAVKRTAMGRFRHENVAIAIGATGKVVAYMGDDAPNRAVYKFVSDGTFDPDNREANLNLLEHGTLYAADFGEGAWIPLVWEGNEGILGDPAQVNGYQINSLGGVLTYAYPAAMALGATPTDRPEDIEVHPGTGDVYIAFTNNSNHGNYHGHITRIMEDGADPESLTFYWDIFAVGGPQSGFSSPDNMAFDSFGNLWMVTDISTGSQNRGIFEFHGNNSLFMFPTDPESDDFGRRSASLLV
jgi:secreted PhoX family phosphatase